jgi:hypothetical protein
MSNSVGGFARNQAHFFTLIEIGGLTVNTLSWERNNVIAFHFMYHSVLHL